LKKNNVQLKLEPRASGKFSSAVCETPHTTEEVGLGAADWVIQDSESPFGL